MNVFTSTELASKTKTVCDMVKEEGCAFVTSNGKVEYLMVSLASFDTLNEAVHSYDQWMLRRQLEKVWRENGSSDITMDDIEDEIRAVRAGRHEVKMA